MYYSLLMRGIVALGMIIILSGCQVVLWGSPPPPHVKIKIRSFEVIPPHQGWGSCSKCHWVDDEDEREHKKKKKHWEDDD